MANSQNVTVVPAIWDDTPKQLGNKGPIQTGEQKVCELICDGIQFRSWLPDSREHAERINAAARKLAGTVTVENE